MKGEQGYFEEPRLTKDALLLSLSEVIEKPPRIISIGRDKKKTVLTINELEIKDKLILQTFLYALIFYACRGYKEIRLTELMEKTGFKKRVWADGSHGFYPKDKAKAINALHLLKNLELRTKPIERRVPYFVLRLFPQAEPKDTIRINPFAIAITRLDNGAGEIKEAIIRFTQNFDINKVYFFSGEAPKVLTLPNEPSELKLFSIFILRRKAFASQNKNRDNFTIVRVANLLRICGIEPDSRHPARTKERLEETLKSARELAIIESYRSLLEGKAYTDVCQNRWGWFKQWRGGEIKIRL
ncbi:MAG: hypothetical protein ACP5RW_03575 [bacterium]